MEKGKTLEKRIYLTHLFKSPVDNTGWIPLPFITQRCCDKNYYLGFEFYRPWSQEDVDSRLKTGEIEQLTNKIQIKRTQTPYLTPQNEIYLADETKQLNDLNKILIRK